MRPLLALLLAAALSRAAPASDRPIFPSDYTPHPCAPKSGVCATTLKQSELTMFAARVHGYTLLKHEWVQKHWDEMVAALPPYCAKLATCYATGSNMSLFCDNVTMPTMLEICERFPEGSSDREQCSFFIRTYATGMTLNAFDAWREAQACRKASADPSAPPRKLEVWTTPATVPVAWSGKFFVHAIDAETKVPVQGKITIGNEQLYADTPGGHITTSHPIKWKANLVRVAGTNVRRAVAPPKITIEAEGYQTVTFPAPVEMREVVVEMTPPPSELRRGKNVVTISARDAATGKPVDARVMLGDRVLGEANQPLEIEIERGRKRPEIWVTSLFNEYRDVVVAPAEN